MEHWQYLLQKEGDRAWRPLKNQKIAIAEGRYRLVVHSSRTNTDVEIYISHLITDENPPKRRFQKRSHHTNPEGLMVVIPFTYLKPGLWEIGCSGVNTSDTAQDTWKEVIQLRVEPQVSKTATDTPPSTVELTASPDAQKEETSTQSTSSDVLVATTEVSTDAEVQETSAEVPSAELAQTTPTEAEIPASKPKVTEIEEKPVSTPTSTEEAAEVGNITDTPQLPSESVDENISVEQEVIQPESFNPEPIWASDTELDETESQTETITPVNQIKERSLQMAEEILQQLLEPIWQDIEPLSPEEQADSLIVPILHNKSLAEIDTKEQPYLLTLDKENLIAHQGEHLIVSGKVELQNVPEFRGSVNSLFKGALLIELRNPQNLQLLLDIEQPLPKHRPPFEFSFSLELPPDCQTRLILGEVILVGSSQEVLASQSFTITADLQALLKAIDLHSTNSTVETLPEEVAPEEKRRSLAEATLNQDEKAESLTRPIIHLIPTPKSPQPIQFQPVANQPLPPQIYQPSATAKTIKSLHLPNFPKPQPVATVSEVETSDAENDLSTLADGFSELFPETPEDQLAEVDTAIGDLPDAEEISSEPEAEALTANSSEQTDVELPLSNEISQETPALDSSDLAVALEESPESEIEQSLEEDAADESFLVADTFQSLKLQDRFWLRLNAIATDAEFSELLKSELSFVDNQDENISSQDALDTDSDAVAEENLATYPDEAEDTAYYQTPLVDDEAQDTAYYQTSLVNDEVEDTAYYQTPPVNDEVEDTAYYQTSLAQEYVADEYLEEEDSDSLLNELFSDDIDGAEWVGSVDNVPANAEAIAPDSPIESAYTETEADTVLPVSTEDIVANWLRQEIVVEDELAVPEIQSTQLAKPQPETPATPQTIEDIPVPTPELIVPPGELASGEPITVSVKLPPHPARIYVKLWIKDRQSRFLLDGPRSLMDFVPNSLGESETSTYITVPLGILEIRLEAIAVDIYTKRESNKVTVDRIVVPPNLPNLSLAEFEETLDQ